MVKRGEFKAPDLVKVSCPSLDETLTHLLAHIVRCAGNRERLSLIREALREIDQFMVESQADEPVVN